MKKKANTPKRKRYNREQRLLVADVWLKSYEGKSIVSSYARWFGVDKLCAVDELRLLGKEISEQYELSLRESIRAKSAQKQKRMEDEENYLLPVVESDHFFSHIVGYTAAGFAYGVTHEEMSDLEVEQSIEWKRRKQNQSMDLT